MKKFTMLLILSLLLVRVAFTQTVDVIYNVTREAYPTPLPAEGASVSITYTYNSITDTKTGITDANGKVTFSVPLPATGLYRLAETITLANHNTLITTSTTGQRIDYYASSPINAYKYLGLTNTILNVLITKDVAGSGTPIAGASVTFTCASPAINTTLTTDANGMVALPVTRSLTANYTINIAVAPITGYATLTSQTQSIPYMPTSNLTTKNIALMWLYPINFTVTKSDGVTPVSGATLTCTGTPTSTAQTTDAEGKASVTKQKANFNYTIVANGYADTTASIQAANIVDPLNLTIKLRSAYSINFTVTDASVAPVSAAVVTIKPKNSAIPATTLNTATDGKITFLKKTNGIYTYMITRSGYADAAGELTVNDADNNQAITLQAGADFTFTFTNGTNKVYSDTLTLNGVTKFSSSTVNTLVFGLPAGTQNYTFTKSGWVKEAGSVMVDPAAPATNNKTLNLIPIYSLKVQTKNELSQVVPYSYVVFNGNTYKTDATGTVIIPNIAPKAATERQYYDVRIMKEGYAEYNDSIKCGLVSSKIAKNNQHAVDGNLFVFSKPGISINYSEGQMQATAYATLYLNGVDKSSAITINGGGSISDVTPGIYTYWMNYLKPGYATEHGTVEVKANKSGRISVSFAKGYDIQMYTLDAENNPVEAYVTLDDTTMKSSVDDGGVLFKMRKEKSTYGYTAYQKDGSGKIIAKAKGQVILGAVPISGEVIHLMPVADSIVVTVYDAAQWGVTIPGAKVTCDNNFYTTDANGVAIIPVSADGQYTYTVSYDGFFNFTNTVTVAGENVNEDVYLKKQFSASFTVNDGANPIEGAIIKIDGIGEVITGAAGTASFSKTLKKSWDAYTYTVSVIGYPDFTGTFYVSNEDVVIDPISFTTRAYDVTITVNKPDGTPAPNATVTFNNMVYTTNSLGMLLATKVINGTYPIVASAAGYIDYPATVTVADANVNQTITLAGGYDLAVQVINGATGAVGLANTSITINGITKITDASGLVTFGVPANYAVNTTVSKAGFADATLAIADVNANMSVTVYMTPVYNVNIRVMDNNSYNPIQAATVVFNGETKLSDVDGFAKYLNVAPSATAYEYSVTGPGTYNSSNGTIDLPLSSPAEYVENGNNVDKTVGLTSPYVFITLTNGMMSYYGAATITFDGVDYAYETGFGGNSFNCTLGTHVYVVTPADETKAILRGSVVLTEQEPGAYVAVNVVDGRKVEIYVVDKNTEPIEGAEVVLNGFTLNTDASGGAIFLRSVPGDYTYTVTKTGYISQTNPLSVNTADVLELVTLLMPEYTATFTVTDGIAAIADAKVTIGGQEVLTDAEGKAVFSLSAGAYDYSVSKAAYTAKTGSITVVDAAVTENVALALTVYTVTIKVSDGTSAVAGAEVTVGTKTLVTGADGLAVFAGLLPGEHAYTVSKDAYVTRSGSVTLVDKDVTENVTMVLTTYAILFNVSYASLPVADAEVKIGSTVITTNAEGKALFVGLLPGEYNYTVTKTGYGVATGTVTITNADVIKDLVLLSDVGLHNKANGTLRVYPNPTNGVLHLNIPETGNDQATVRITNIIGKVLYENKLVNNPGEAELDLSGFENGIYFVKVIGNGFENSVKVIKN